MNIVAGLTVEALGRLNGEARPHYRQALTTACRKSAPVFGTRRYSDIYRAVAVNPYWMATSLMMNAQREGEGAGQLWDLGVSTPDESVAAQVRQHAIDESRHSRAYCAARPRVSRRRQRGVPRPAHHAFAWLQSSEPARSSPRLAVRPSDHSGRPHSDERRRDSDTDAPTAPAPRAPGSLRPRAAGAADSHPRCPGSRRDSSHRLHGKPDRGFRADRARPRR